MTQIISYSYTHQTCTRGRTRSFRSHRAEPLSARHGSEHGGLLCQDIRDFDRALGALYRYLEEHYSPEEYLVNIYSDHGVPVFSEHHYIVSPDLTHAAWMMRGAGGPEGMVADELTSAVDIYPTLGALCDFPVGDDVDGVQTVALYPAKSYCLHGIGNNGEAFPTPKEL